MNRFEAVRKFARRIVDRFDLMPPIDVSNIFSEMDIQIVEEENQYGIEAYSQLNDNKVIINTEITYIPRRRFTLAHELGHICIPWHNGDVKCIAGEHYIQVSGKRLLDTQELEANIFASELLMPTSWVKEKIEEYLEQGFQILVRNITESAQTSTMACFFALENAMPSGNIFFVKKETDEYWRTFSSVNTCTISWNYLAEKNMEFLDVICEKKEECKISQYGVIYYQVLPCPTTKVIIYTYHSCGKNLYKLLNAISENQPIKVLPFLDVVLNAIPENYVVFLINDDAIIKTLCNNTSPLRMFYRGLGCTQIISIAKYYGFTCNHIQLSNAFSILYIKEKYFAVPECGACDPNKLLKCIVSELYWDDNMEHMLKSINGIVAGMNSSLKKASREELYNWIKYRFMTDKKFSEFFEHRYFEKYIVNKIDKMIEMRHG